MLEGLNIRNPMSGPKRLRELVRDIRATKTAAEERAIVNKECALIRDSFRSETQTYRCRNVAKLLYIHMLGYPAHFGQLECLKLIASPRFTDKRVGHLGAMLLLDERTDVHLLVTNSLKNDLNHSTPYVVSLALCTLGSICSVEMSRDLAGEVERIIKGQNTYLKKKAALCAFRIIRKVPDLLEMFIPCTRALVQEKNHGVMLSTITLITEMCILSKDTLQYFKKQMIPTLIRSMKNLILVGYSSEHEVNKISDPFLQVKILRLMRLLGTGDRVVSEQLNDILAQVATNTETSKNVGHAILYEIVLTIMGIESDPGLRVLAVNILGRFLLNSDKNIRYVALNTLKQVVNADYKAVQRHRGTILDCLKDADVSIQRRAVDLCFTLTNTSNIRVMVKEMLAFLSRCDDEFKGDVCSNLLVVADLHAPSKKWHFDTILQLLTTAGNHARDDVVSSFVALISQMQSLHSYAVHHLYGAITNDLQQQPLVQAACWCIGEYGDLLCQPMENSTQDDDGNTGNLYAGMMPRGEREILDTFAKALTLPLTSTQTKQMIIVALTKLSIRLSDVHLSRIRELVDFYGTSMKLELQQRSAEFSQLLSHSGAFRRGLLECMPPMECKLSALNNSLVATKMDDQFPVEGNGLTHLNGNTNNTNQNILDLLSNGFDSVSIAPNTNAELPNPALANDLLDLFMVPSTVTDAQTKPSNDLFNDLFTNEQPTGIPSLTVFEANSIVISFDFEKLSSTQTNVMVTSRNLGAQLIENFELLAAVPKSFQLQVMPPSGNLLMMEPVSQTLKITNPTAQRIRMRVKLQYRVAGVDKCDQFQVDNFPDQLWSQC